jgi:uncharacterized protein YajQ (UPF0234 family)
MALFSFDIVSEYNKAEMNNVFQLVEREIANRYDFKGTKAEVNWLDNKKGFKIIGDNEWQVDTVIDIVRKKLASRNQSSKVLDLSKDTHESNLRAMKDVPFREGLDQEKAKKLTKIIRDEMSKVKTQIQGETVRVMSAKKDELQSVMQLIHSADLDFPVSFTNYR